MEKLSGDVNVQSSLEEEILQLQKQLESQFVVRSALEKALDRRSISHDPSNENSNSTNKPSMDLIKEIAVLELEVVYLEKYLLSLYRKTFDKRSSHLSLRNDTKKPNSLVHKRSISELNGQKVKSNSTCSVQNQKPMESVTFKNFSENLDAHPVQRCHSSLSQRSAHTLKGLPSIGSLAEALDSYHSLPLSMFERVQDPDFIQADHHGTSVSEESPNWVSEEMIKCITSIYYDVADPPLINQNFSASPASFSSSMSESSTYQHDMWSPQSKDHLSFNSWFNNPLHVDQSKEFSRSSFCSTLIEIKRICRDSERLKSVEHMLQRYRLLVSRLRDIDPRKLNQEHKLSFWINMHNALVMHAFLIYGIPQNNLKRISLLLKAAYIIGGQTISVDMIQNSILGCQLPRPGQWFQSLLFPKAKLKGGDKRKSYALDYPQPLLKFALCSGNYSDPPVRMYTPKRIYQELEMAKEEYIQMNSTVRNKNKILIPKIVESYAKEVELCPISLYKMILDSMPASLKKMFDHQPQQGKPSKKIEWVSHNFNFRYLLSRELSKTNEL